MQESVKSRGLRRRRPNFDDSASSWLVTYSDAITLLLAFFVMILAVSDLNEGKVEALKEGLSEVITNEDKPTPFTDIKKGLDEYIEQQGLQDQLSVVLDNKGVKVEFANVALYDSGSADIKTDALPLLEEVSRVIRSTSHSSHMIEVEGHTDDLPIATQKFPSNWELSSARATNVVKYLLSQGLEKERLKASGFADSRPKENTDNLSLEQLRPANRRVVVYVRRY
ncbi:MAG: OmpA family protein [Saccharospirillaceae bacterium]|nr:chemotaxis protein MotB [Thalassolituus sp. HI0120]KZZ43970.1 chemotaxis protein MotB [Thalassolituus sp. HI0120]MCH2040827.1 OmpA family protein [Saccharospirillaceae bacterium]